MTFTEEDDHIEIETNLEIPDGFTIDIEPLQVLEVEL